MPSGVLDRVFISLVTVEGSPGGNREGGCLNVKACRDHGSGCRALNRAQTADCAWVKAGNGNFPFQLMGKVEEVGDSSLPAGK